MKILMIRHGITELSARRCYQGCTDEPLSAAGRQALRESPWCPQKVYVSSLQRTQQTAAIIFPSSEVIAVEGLAEMNFGSFEGKSAQEMIDDVDYRAWVESGCISAPPGGESLERFSNRVCKAFQSVVDEWYATEKTRESNAAVVSEGCEHAMIAFVVHGGTIMATLERFVVPYRSYFPWSIEPGCGYVLKTSRKLWRESRQLHLEGTVSFLCERGLRNQAESLV